MIALIVGTNGCSKLKKVFEELGHHNLESNPTLTEGYALAVTDRGADQSVVQYNPDIIFCDAYFDTFSCIEFKGFLRLAYRKPNDRVGPYANIPIVMMPGTASPISYVRAEATQYNLSFLEDPSDPDKVRALLDEITAKKGGKK